MEKLRLRRYSTVEVYNSQKEQGLIPEGALFIILETKQFGTRKGNEYIITASNAEERLVDLEAAIVRIDANIDEIEVNIDDIETDLTALTTRVTTNEENIAQLRADFEGQNQRLETRIRGV